MNILTNISKLYTCEYDVDTAGFRSVVIENAAIVWDGDKIVWVGEEVSVPQKLAISNRFDANGGIVSPGFIDAHTHLAFGGWRDDEFRLKLEGVPYLDIARNGGGIRSTVAATGNASLAELTNRARMFLSQAMKLGVTTMEAKSGYGLDLENEVKQLEVYRELDRESPISIIATFLGAHTYPKAYQDDHKGFIRLLIDQMMPEVRRRDLATFFDIFVEDTAFSVAEAREILEAAAEHGFKLKLHVDQITSGGGAELAAEFSAVSADHLEFVSDNGIAALRKSGTVPVSLPLASMYLGMPPLPARKMLAEGLPVAIATDFNPGSAPSYNLQLAMWLGCTFQRMTPHEVLLGVTHHAALALDIFDQVGSLKTGKKADFLVMNVESIDHWMYHFVDNPVRKVFKNGQPIVEQ